MTTAAQVLPAALAQRVTSMPGLHLLVLYGSRARGQARPESDWDFGYEADAGFDADGLLALLAEGLNADRIDLVDLDRVGALLRHRVAQDGRVVFERTPGRFERFWLDAVHAWCELEPVLTPLYAGVLEALPS